MVHEKLENEAFLLSWSFFFLAFHWLQILVSNLKQHQDEKQLAVSLSIAATLSLHDNNFLSLHINDSLSPQLQVALGAAATTILFIAGSLSFTP